MTPQDNQLRPNTLLPVDRARGNNPNHTEGFIGNCKNGTPLLQSCLILAHTDCTGSEQQSEKTNLLQQILVQTVQTNRLASHSKIKLLFTYLVICPKIDPPMKDAAGTATPKTPTANVCAATRVAESSGTATTIPAAATKLASPAA